MNFVLGGDHTGVQLPQFVDQVYFTVLITMKTAYNSNFGVQEYRHAFGSLWTNTRTPAGNDILIREGSKVIPSSGLKK